MQHFPKLAKDPTRRGPNCDGWVFQGIGDGRDAYHVANGSVHKQAAWQSPYLVQILKVGFINKVFQVAHGCAEVEEVFISMKWDPLCVWVVGGSDIYAIYYAISQDTRFCM